MERLLAEFAREHLGKDEPRPPAMIAEALRDQAAFYARHIPFAVGDLVTPPKGTMTKGAGNDHIVIDVREDAEPDLSLGEEGSSSYGKRHDMRVLSWDGGRYPAHWVESAEFEAWTDPNAKPAADPAPAA